MARVGMSAGTSQRSQIIAPWERNDTTRLSVADMSVPLSMQG